MRFDRPRGRIRSLRPALEALEPRSVPAQFGVPWHDPFHLSVSFAPDGTAIAGQASDLFQALDSQMPQAQWQALILEAFQLWAAPADVNFALTTDGGEPFGTPGPDQHDPRFGDIRIGAQPMPPDVLAISVPHDPFLSGTWSGDIVLNSDVLFNGRNASLLPVMLHEVGHVLGLGESDDPGSVMFPTLNPEHTSLSPGDVAAVLELYGPRLPDTVAGPADANVAQVASPFPAPQGYDGTTPLFLYADLASSQAADVYSLQAPAGYNGPATFRLQSAGVSLLMPRLTVYDAEGRVVGAVASTSQGGDTLLLTVPDATAGATYYVKVQAATAGVFGVGEYALAATFDARSTVSQDAIDQLARQSYSYLSPDDLNAIFLDPQNALFANDGHTNDTAATATPLGPADASYGSEAPIRTIASLGDPGDVDFYRFETPEEPAAAGPSIAPLVMTVTVRTTEVNGVMPTVSVLDAAGAPVDAQVLAHGDGTYTIQVADASPDTTYYVRVSADPTGGKAVGNYDLDIEYGHVAADPATFVTSAVSPGANTANETLVVNEPQLFDFLLAAPGTVAPGTALTLTLTDAAGRVVLTRTASDGVTAGGDPVLLVPGVYQATFAFHGGSGVAPRSWSFRLYGASLTDPIGPALDDPTLTPIGNPSARGAGGVAPPGIAAPDAPYQWLAVTLAAPSEPAGPVGPRAAAARGPAASIAFGVLGSLVPPLGAAAALLSGTSLTASAESAAADGSAAHSGRGPVASSPGGTVTIGLGPFAESAGEATPTPAADGPPTPVDPTRSGEPQSDAARDGVAVVASSTVTPRAEHGPIVVAGPGVDPRAAVDAASPVTDSMEEAAGGLVVCVTLVAYAGCLRLRHLGPESRRVTVRPPTPRAAHRATGTVSTRHLFA